MPWKSIKTGFLSGFNYLRFACIVYLVQLMLAIIIGLQIYQVLDASIGHSLEIGKLLKGYDHTTLMDFLNVHGGSVSPLLGQMRWIILVYFIVSVFLHAGILGSVVQQENQWSDFWKNASGLFVPFLKMALIFLAFSLLLMCVILLPIFGGFPDIIEKLPSEKTYFFLTGIALLVYLLCVIAIFNWSILARIDYIRNRVSIWKSFRKTMIWSIQRYFSLAIIFIGFIIIIFCISAIYLLVADKVGMTTPLLIIFIFLFQQAVILSRILVRIMHYSALDSFYLSGNYLSDPENSVK